MNNKSIKRESGFTLIELMIVLAVSAIILGVGLPSFLSLIEKTKIRNVKDDIVELVRLARLTAVEQKVDVKVCGSGNGLTCSSSNADWGNIILAVKDEGEDALTVLMRIDVSNRATVTKNNASNLEIDFQPTGWAPGDNLGLFICPESGGSDNAYKLSFSQSGKIRFESYEECTS